MDVLFNSIGCDKDDELDAIHNAYTIELLTTGEALSILLNLHITCLDPIFSQLYPAKSHK